MRGKPLAVRAVAARLRITPADAGKTGFLVVCTKQAEDHPRGCGENSIRLSDSADAVGSPPRMRGKH